MNRKIAAMLVLCLILIGCKGNIPFDKTGWTELGDIGLYPNRDKMLDDLTRNQKLKGLTYQQLIEKIGAPEENVGITTDAIYYNIVTDFGHDIDPVYTKILEFKFDKDSIISDFKINETKH